MNFIISVGRNIGSVPMDIRRWQECQCAVLAAAQLAAKAIYFKGCGSGVYIDLAEESFTVIGELRGASTLSSMGSASGILSALRERDAAVDALRKDLSFIASRYEQESSALTFGQPEFVTP
jgi:hypothetical protein